MSILLPLHDDMVKYSSCMRSIYHSFVEVVKGQVQRRQS